MKLFEELSVSQPLCDALKKIGIREATPVQEQAIPALRNGRDTIVQAQTGTGKTLAFLLPLYDKIKTQADNVQTLIITPTRELTIQISKVAALLDKAVGVRSMAIYGGQDIERQKRKLGRDPHVIIGTPGRILDHLRRRTLNFSTTNKIVLDEADEMLRRGFIEDVETILSTMAKDRQIMLFSATMPDRIKSLAHRYMVQVQHIEIKAEHITLDTIKQRIVDTVETSKVDKLCELINEEQPYLAMVFCSTRSRVSQVAMTLAKRGYLADELHGELSQLQRTNVLKKFRQAKLQILVTTDIAARGLDIEGVTHVFNYDIPQDTESYIHRIGRTGRAGQKGVAITFVNARQYSMLRKIEAGIKNHITKDMSTRSLASRLKREKREKELAAKKQQAEKQQAKQAKSKYANRKGSAHKGRNDRSRRLRDRAKRKK
ncbi:Cold-shock DEAD-box protein A [Anaerovibrio sp. JC8]|uniref:DEAD/DEAH box helicase n=1 Tax=Anaerovibrio sp. JC8 TaxID=1240085 RepID=UPI000A0986AC|nr:DEAD/DEAH box helicase [Anaerovibrio sp. JC8]ORT99618.1 Cold-shock DEAD-box protein A [Anaerovibrio sp. JC8]